MYDKVCPSCGKSLSTFYQTGYMGCPDCYREFKNDIKPAIKKIQGSSVHTGKCPKLTAIDRELLEDYKRYLKEKERAGIEGRFSDMAKLNKIISDLAEELKRRGIL